MLEKLATHDVETVSTLFALPDKRARAAEGQAWHSSPQTGAAQTGGSGAVPRDGKNKKRAAATRSRGQPLKSSQLQLGAGATTISAHGRRGVTVVHALYTPTVAIAPQSVARSSTSRNASASGVSSLPRTAPHLVADLARKGSTTARSPRLNGTSGISHPRGS
jgi:hypothetical protein